VRELSKSVEEGRRWLRRPGAERAVQSGGLMGAVAAAPVRVLGFHGRTVTPPNMFLKLFERITSLLN
jgi:hypothetical protein